MAVSRTLEKYFIVRIAWVFGLNGKNFIKTMLNVGKTHDTVRVVNDQIGTPTYTLDLARLLIDMNETDKYGYYHATNEGGYISWYDFTKEIYRQAGYTTQVVPEQGGAAVQQSAGQEQTGGSWVYAAADVAGCAAPLFAGNWAVRRAPNGTDSSRKERRWHCRTLRD